VPLLFADTGPAVDDRVIKASPFAWEAWRTAFVLGITALTLAIIVGRQIKRSSSVLTGRLVLAALVIAWLGACTWALPMCAAAGEGL
jgi:hypothetical protein